MTSWVPASSAWWRLSAIRSCVYTIPGAARGCLRRTAMASRRHETVCRARRTCEATRGNGRMVRIQKCGPIYIQSARSVGISSSRYSERRAKISSHSPFSTILLRDFGRPPAYASTHLVLRSRLDGRDEVSDLFADPTFRPRRHEGFQRKNVRKRVDTRPPFHEAGVLCNPKHPWF